jgi:hypothetical protein
LNTSFERLAQKVNTTQTNLMNDILNEYLNWSQFMVNHESPFLTFGSRTAVALIESVEDAALEKIIKEISNEEAIDFVKFRWKRVNFRNIVRFLDLSSLYANIGSINVSLLNGNKNNGNNDNTSNTSRNQNQYDNKYMIAPNNETIEYEIAVRHHLGKPWSKFLAIYISNIFTSSIPSVEARCEVSNISCFVYLKMQPAR